jgi:hypothetical protein
VLHTSNLDGHFIKVPLVSGTGQPPPDAAAEEIDRIGRLAMPSSGRV